MSPVHSVEIFLTPPSFPRANSFHKAVYLVLLRSWPLLFKNTAQRWTQNVPQRGLATRHLTLDFCQRRWTHTSPRLIYHNTTPPDFCLGHFHIISWHTFACLDEMLSSGQGIGSEQQLISCSKKKKMNGRCVGCRRSGSPKEILSPRQGRYANRTHE